MSTHPRIPDDVAALISAHALGALEPDQAALAEQHIAASDDCRRAYEDALEMAAALAMAVADSEPPADLRDRILAAARAEGTPAAQPAAKPSPVPPAPVAGLLTPRRLRGPRRGRRRRFALIAVSSTTRPRTRATQDALVSSCRHPTRASCRSL